MEYPNIAPFKYIFSRAVKSPSKPAPNSIIGDITPSTSTLPSVGFITPLTTFKRVLFPAPLEPINPTTSPFSTLKVIFFKAQKSLFFTLFLLSNNLIKIILRELSFSIPKLNRIPTFFILIIFPPINNK